MRKIVLVIIMLLCPGWLWGADFPLIFMDSSGQKITLTSPPKRVVSLVPAVTEILMRIGASDAVQGITYHSVLPPETTGKEIVGGFFAPDLERITALEPDLIFYADLQSNAVSRFQGQVPMVLLNANSIQQDLAQIRLLGRIFGHEQQAEKIIAEEQRQLEIIDRKVARIPAAKRQRVVRLMGRDKVMAPGDDSFQNDYIRAAGGIPPSWGRKGNITRVSKEEWQDFNPQVVYSCGYDHQIPALIKSGWNEVEAVRQQRLLFFPCALTCRAASHPGYFVSWLAARIYGLEFGEEDNFVLAQQVVGRRSLSLDLSYVAGVEIIESDIKDFRNKTLALRFREPMMVVSSLEGQRSGITTVANHYFPPPSWGLGHEQGLAGLRTSTMAVLGLDPANTAMLFTGANMENLAVVRKSFRNMEVYALVTAGVMGNALRMGADTGSFYEPDSTGRHKKPGTINIILLSNMRLSSRAMTRAIISATEGKTAALQDMDIRSSSARRTHQATGTGTDNIIVVQGQGEFIDASGGHTKMGELIAKAVYAGVQQAVHRQNGLDRGRSVFQRLKERNISLHELCRSIGGGASLRREVERLLLTPRYAAFIKAMMAMSDAHEQGLFTDLDAVQSWCGTMAGGSYRPIDLPELPKVMAHGLGSLLTRAARIED